MRMLDLFSGIGGFSLAASWVWGDDLEIVGFCEIEEYCQKVLAKNFPLVPIYSDIRELKGEQFNNIDLITGGFPCQDISVANQNGKGIEGERSGLWKEMHRLISEIRPSFCLLENVAALFYRGLSVVLADLAQIGYDAEWNIVSAQDIGAPHLRKRIWIVAHTMRPRLERHTRHEFDGNQSRRFNPRSNRSTGGPSISIGQQWAFEPAVGRVANGIPKRMDRLRGLGNAVVPQIVEWIARRIITENGNDVTANSNCRADGERGVRTVQSLCGSSEATAEGERVGDDGLPRPLCHR